jgi:hypothetical protein
VETMTGFEPVTSGVNRRSTKLSYIIDPQSLSLTQIHAVSERGASAKYHNLCRMSSKSVIAGSGRISGNAPRCKGENVAKTL